MYVAPVRDLHRFGTDYPVGPGIHLQRYPQANRDAITWEIHFKINY
jgi:hypothetical protein